MKIAIFALLLLTNTAFAESVRFKVGSISARIRAEEGLILSDAKAVISCYWCTVTTCAGGPEKAQELKTTLKAVETDSQGAQIYELRAEGGRVSGSKLFKNLRGCGYYIQLKGSEAQSARQVTGTVDVKSNKVEPSGDISYVSGVLKSLNPTIKIWKDAEFANQASQLLNQKPIQVFIKKQWSDAWIEARE
jgi:hypothetical protein